MPLTVYCDTSFPEQAQRALVEGLAAHRLLLAASPQRSNLVGSAPDPAIALADVAFGQPSLDALREASLLCWVHLTSAGYTRYDTPEVRRELSERGVMLTTSSAVYADPCAEHALAMILAMARRLPDALDDQRGARTFAAAEQRARSFLLRGQTVLLLGYGAIGRRLAALLAPFEVRLLVFRRSAQQASGVSVVSAEALDEALATADHVVNVLPGNETTKGFLSRDRIARLRPEAFLYNVGRGSTVDQDALVDALSTGRIAGAYLDVTDPEPLPPEHPLWSLPSCYITPHAAGGQRGEHLALVRHFLANLGRFERGEVLVDRVI